MEPKDIERFWSHVDKSGECWLWTSGTFFGRYGRFKVKGRSLSAHRLAYELQNGPLGDGMQVNHRCDTPLCVRGDHLLQGTQLDNMRDRKARGRWKGGRPVGAKDSTPRDFTKNREGLRRRFAKVTIEDVRAIRSRYAADQRITYKQLGTEYGVTGDAIYRIVRRYNWKDVA